MAKINISNEVFLKLADAAVRSVGRIEGWCDVHDSWRIVETPATGQAETVFSSRKFRVEFRRQLKAVGVVVRRS